MSKNSSFIRSTAIISSVDFIFRSPNNVTRTAYVELTFAKEDGSEIILRFDLITVGAKFCHTYYDWTYKQLVHDGFIQLYQLMLFFGVDQPKFLEGCSVIILENDKDFVFTKSDSKLMPRNKVKWWSSKTRTIFKATLAQTMKKI